MIDLMQFLGIAGAPLVIALVSATRAVFPDLESRWAPLLAFGWAAPINALVAYGIAQSGTAISWPVVILAWVLCALVASGFYSQGKAATGN